MFWYSNTFYCKIFKGEVKAFSSHFEFLKTPLEIIFIGTLVVFSR